MYISRNRNAGSYELFFLMSILFSMEASLETGFSLWVGTIPWKREWQPTLVLLPGKSHEQRSLAAYSPWDSRVSDSTKHTCQQSLVSPVVVEPFYNPIHSVYGLPFLHISVNAYYFLFSFNSTQPSEYKMISYYSFNFHFFLISDVEYFLTNLLAICVSSMKKMSIQEFCTL